MSDLAKRPSTLPAVPTTKELEAIAPGDRWVLEDRLGEAQDVLRAFNDDELRRWVEVEGKTQREIAELVGRDQSRVSRRCAALGIEFSKGKGTLGGRPRAEVMRAHNSEDDDDAEEVDAEIVDDDPEPIPDPGPRVRCPTCGYMVKPGDIGV